MTPVERPRVMMISKALVVGIYQRKLELIAAQDVDLLAVVPPAWKDERGKTPLERAYTEGYRLETLPLRFNGSFHLHFYARLRQLMRSFRPHIVHIDEEPYNLSAWQAFFHARRLKAKTVVFSWQNLLREYPAPFRWGEGRILKKVDHLLTGTQTAADVWRAKGYKGPVTVLPQFGTDTNLFKPPGDVLARREGFTIGFLGRLVEEKGVQVLLQAAARLHGDWNLRLLGTGPYESDLIKRSKDLGIRDRVAFDGWLPSTQITGYYHKLDVLVIPSLTRPNWKEQFGRVIVEAMASGVPVIGSDSGAIPGVIGDAGLISPEGDVDALAEALQTLQSDFSLRAHFSLLGRERAERHFTHAQIANETVTVYRSLMAT